jgi:hypothetical protein
VLSFARGVGQYPDALASVGSACVTRSHNTPPRIIPQRGKVSEDSGKSSSHKQRAVFHEDEARQYLTDNACHLAPQSAALSRDACALSGAGNVLAREAASDDIHHATPWSAGKCPHIVPNGEGREASVVLPRREDFAAIGVDFDRAHGAESAQHAAEYASARTREKCQLIHLCPRFSLFRLSFF